MLGRANFGTEVRPHVVAAGVSMGFVVEEVGGVPKHEVLVYDGFGGDGEAVDPCSGQVRGSMVNGCPSAISVSR
jgi:hypothetical protein